MGCDSGANPSAKRQDGPGTGLRLDRLVGQTTILQSAPNGSDVSLPCRWCKSMY